jgi:hypothetical protein
MFIKNKSRPYALLGRSLPRASFIQFEKPLCRF